MMEDIGGEEASGRYVDLGVGSKEDMVGGAIGMQGL